MELRLHLSDGELLKGWRISTHHGSRGLQLRAGHDVIGCQLRYLGVI